MAWRQVGENACISRGMVIESSAPLSVCGIDKFQGVEYVCCPSKKTESTKSDENSVESSREKINEQEVKDEETSSEELTTDYYGQYLRNVGKELLNEHEYFLRAKGDLHKQHREKISKIMEEWNTAKKHVEELKKKDVKAAENLNKEVTERFQKTYEALDQEHIAEMRQLLLVHEERVQAALKKKRQDSFNKFRNILSDNSAEEDEIVDALQHYIRTEQKIRLHDVNRYEHLSDRDPMEAESVRQQIIDHLHLVDVRIQETIDLLTRVPEPEKKIRVQMEEYLKTFHDIDVGVAGILAEQVEAQLQTQQLPDEKQIPVSESHSVEEVDDKSTEHTTEEVLEKEVAKDNSVESAEVKVSSSTVEEAAIDDTNNFHPYSDLDADHPVDDKVAHHEVNNLDAEQMRMLKRSDIAVHTSIGHGAVVGIAVGTVTVFIVLVVGLAIIRRRPYDMTVSHTVDEGAAPESQLSQMQANGYENPTYKFFEMRTGNHA